MIVSKFEIALTNKDLDNHVPNARDLCKNEQKIGCKESEDKHI